jgi:hypothetical protein
MQTTFRPKEPRGPRNSVGRCVHPEIIRVGERFNPYKLFNGLFIPEAVARYRGLSAGAKIIYGRLYRYAGENGDAHPSIETLGAEVGLGETQARQYLRELTRGAFVECEHQHDETGRQTSNQYYFLWHEAFDGALGETRKKPEGGVRKTEPSTLRISGPRRVRKTEPKENHHQESPKEESQQKPPGLNDAAAMLRNARPVSQKRPEKPNHFSPNADDDRNPTAKREAFSDPRAEFKARVGERHPGTDGKYVLDCLSRELSEKNIELADFLEFDAKCTTNPGKIQNPTGYYRDLARRLNGELVAAAYEQRRELSEQITALMVVCEGERPVGPKCPLCHEIEGKGIVLSADGKGIEPCSCATAEFATEFRAKESQRRKHAIELAAERLNSGDAATGEPAADDA